MCGKKTCKVKPFRSQDHFSAKKIYYLAVRNSVEYVSELSQSFSLWEGKIKV